MTMALRSIVINLTNFLKAAADQSNFRKGKEIHAHIIACGFSDDLKVVTAVVNMYFKCNKILDGRITFDKMPDKDLVSWNAVVSGYSQNGMGFEALRVVSQLQATGEKPDSITIVAALPACADLKFLRTGKSCHGYSIRAGFCSLINVSTALVGMYARSGSLAMASLVFDAMKLKNVVVWNSIIDGYAQLGNSQEALDLFAQMLAERIRPTEVTIMAAAHACGDLKELDMGKKVHQLLSELKLDDNVSAMNSLIAMYSKCKGVEDGEKIFNSLRQKGTETLVSWNAMISCYVQNCQGVTAIELFRMMLHGEDNLRPDSFTLASVIPAIADLSILRLAKSFHGFSIRHYLYRDTYLATATIDMYAKCGSLLLARRIFDSMNEKHMITWNAMIDGYGTHGQVQDALQLFDEMRTSFQPNEITFLCVLSACSHSGMVSEGRRAFAAMKEVYNLEPGDDHYSAMVDLLGRAGYLDEAWKLIQSMQSQPGICTFGAMLSACKLHRNVDMAEKTANQLFSMNPGDGRYHVLLSNIYAAEGMWENVAYIRHDMEKKDLRKTPGWTSIELKNELHTFFSGDTSHPISKKIYQKLESLMDEIKMVGYVPNLSSMHDVDEDVQEQLLRAHSEKLAIAFGLLSSPAGSTLHLRKNLRVCVDCHAATKLISLVTGREIVVRDMQRFHHFKSGRCSCGDYW